MSRNRILTVIDKTSLKIKVSTKSGLIADIRVLDMKFGFYTEQEMRKLKLEKLEKC